MSIKFLEDTSRNDPDSQGIPPLKRGVWLLPRFILLSIELLLSNPWHLVLWYRSFFNRIRAFTFCLPWLTFSAIDFISASVGAGTRIFEYGAGYSTIYWLQKDAEVFAVEETEYWLELIKKKINANKIGGATLYHEISLERYVGSIHSAGGLFDLIIVDGSFRHECLAAAVQCVSPGGLLVLDNSDWIWFKRRPLAGIPDDWRKLTFHGPVPMAGARNETTVWRRPITQL